MSISKEENCKFLLFGTKKGLIKRTSVREFENIRKTGKLCITLKETDELVDVKKTDGECDIMLASSSGKMALFNENEIRVMGRTASGVRGINLDGATCVSIETTKETDNVIIVSEKGYGKKTTISEFRKTRRGSKGVKALNITEKNGNIVSIKRVVENSDLMIITDSGIVIRIPIEQISQLGRVTQGTRLINLKENQIVSSISLIKREEESNTEETSEEITI